MSIRHATTMRQLLIAPSSLSATLVQVYFPADNVTLAYYNDSFKLHKGDIVFVDGKFEGKRGLVTEVNHNFKIRASDYKRVIAVADMQVHGEFFAAGSHFVTFDRDTLPPEKIITWYKAPTKEGDDFISSSDDTAFPLDKLADMNIDPAVAERGYEYYCENRVQYLCVDGTKGYAIVEGRDNYEVEFTLKDGVVSHLLCPCFCHYTCKHEFAAMLQLKDLLQTVTTQYADQYAATNFFAAICADTLLTFIVKPRKAGRLTL
ncbi:MAG: hypothetical protein IJF42_01575 [Clostridia bacterium]|nr:hypothetical protein [Clostridia bacterium]